MAPGEKVHFKET